MTEEAVDLVGRVAADLMRRTLDKDARDAGCARFLIHALSTPEVVAIVNAVRDDAALSRRLEVCLPRYRFWDVPGVDPAFLTDVATTELRHSECTREGRVMVLTDDSQMQSLAQVTKMDADALLDESMAFRWIALASRNMALEETVLAQWEAALRALLRIDRVAILQVAAFISASAGELAAGAALPQAVGSVLMTIGVPRFSTLFDDIAKARLRQPSQWRQRLETHWRRDCYMAKRDLSQLPLSHARLRERFEEMRGTLDAEIEVPLRAYVDAPGGVSAASVRLFEHDWTLLRQFFEEVQKADAKSIGVETHDFYLIRAPELLTDDERDYLTIFKEQRRSSPTKSADDERFYASHALELKEEPRLSTLWERFVFGQRVECRDLLDGIVQCLRRIYQPQQGATQLLVVEGLERTEAAFLPLNDSICRTFALRYRGLPDHLRGIVDFRQSKAFAYPDFRDLIANYQRRMPDGTGSRARQLNFKVWLETREAGVVSKSAELRLVWECDLDAVGSGFRGDLERLRLNGTGGPLVRCAAGRPGMRSRAGSSGLDLRDVSSLEPAAARDRGSFVPSSRRCVSLAKEWKEALAELQADALIEPVTAGRLASSFSAFEAAYRRAIDDRSLVSAAAPSIAEQAALYGETLKAVVEEVEAPVGQERLLRPLLEVGVAQIEAAANAPAAAVVCPWHPLRFGGQAARWDMFRDRLGRLFVPDAPPFTDAGGLFFSEFRRLLAEAPRPEATVGWTTKPTLLSLFDHVEDYSLHDRPVAKDNPRSPAGGNVRPVAQQIAALLRSYVKLQPHETANLSVVLYNCDSAALPQAVIECFIASGGPEDGEVTFEVMLRHREETRLRDLYRHLVSGVPSEDTLSANEATTDFMSRLRISVLVNQAPPPEGPDGPPFDIAFCYDVISRAASPDWTEVDRVVMPAARIDPGHWSRRRPIRRGDRDAMAYLACPAQPLEGWAHLDALAALHQPQQARRALASGLSLMPVRRTDVQDPATREVIDETHRLANWVVNYDDLLDRRQLLDNRIRVIRYKHAATGGRNLVISSTAPDALLRATLKARLRALDPSYGDDHLQAFSSKLIEDANATSGDLVLRAARRGNNASELIGVVLSRFLMQHEFENGTVQAWIFLDDYAAWLGQDEGRIADLLCLAPSVAADGTAVLDVVVSEAKYVAARGASVKAQDSARQLRDTLARLEAALVNERAPADRDIWRARLTDMLLDGLRDPGGRSLGVDWRTALRDGSCRFVLRGYSHVFAHASPGSDEAVEDVSTKVAGTLAGLQQTFSPGALRRLLACYADGTSPRTVLANLGFGPPPHVWSRPDADGDLTGSPPPSKAAAPSGSAAVRDDGAATVEPMAGAAPAIADVATANADRRNALDVVLASARSPTLDMPEDNWLATTAARCRTALQGYGLSARLEEQVLTPNAALLKFKGSDNMTVAAVERKTRELETTHRLKVLNVRAEPGRVVIQIGRPVRAQLSLADVWAGWSCDTDSGNARLLIGVKEEDGSLLFLAPEPAPHTLIAGSTGSGKSVLVQNILLSIAASNRPDLARIVLIDPKSGVDYFAFDNLPHLDGGIIDDREEAMGRLEGLVREMERRYALFKVARVANLASYNRTASTPLPMIWLVHDEFADWMQLDDYRAGVETAVNRLGGMARAAGIYLIFAAQRPDNTVFPMLLRSNLGNRLILRVDSVGTSDLSLGFKGGGAERLLGKGHLAAVFGGGTVPTFAQVPYVSEELLVRLVDAIRADAEAGV